MLHCVIHNALNNSCFKMEDQTCFCALFFSTTPVRTSPKLLSLENFLLQSHGVTGDCNNRKTLKEHNLVQKNIPIIIINYNNFIYYY